MILVRLASYAVLSSLLIPLVGGHSAVGNRRVVIQGYANGQPRRVAWYRNDKLDGEARGWYESGALMFRYHYRKGLREGLQEVWYPDGRPFTSFHYRRGQEVNQQRMWNPDGTIRSNYVIKNGRRYGLLGAMGCTGVR